MREQCKQWVYSGERWDFAGHRCKRFAKRDGYCNFHHPENLEKRNQALHEKWAKERENTPLAIAQKRIKELEEKLLNLPSLSGVGVREKCHHYRHMGDTKATPMEHSSNCECHGTGYIERQAEWGDIPGEFFSHAVKCLSRYSSLYLTTASGGRLFVKEEKG